MSEQYNDGKEAGEFAVVIVGEPTSSTNQLSAAEKTFWSKFGADVAVPSMIPVTTEPFLVVDEDGYTAGRESGMDARRGKIHF